MEIGKYAQILEGDSSGNAWNSVMFLYRSALKKAVTKIEILNDEFQNVHQYTPIEYVKSRIKKPESIAKKLKRNGCDDSIYSMVTEINDIAGVRVVCSFTSDIYRLAEMVSRQPDVHIKVTKDYIANPKTNGYKSYHMVGVLPIYLSNEYVVDVPVEIQIRTLAMDFWASLEHKIYYKYEGYAPDNIKEELKACSDVASMLDAKMLQLNRLIHGDNQ